MKQRQLTLAVAVCAMHVLLLTNQAVAWQGNMVFNGAHVENGVPLTYSGFGDMDFGTGDFFYTWDFSPEPFAKTTIMTNDPWGKKSWPWDSTGFSLYEFSGFDITVAFHSSDQFGNSVDATIEVSGTPVMTMDITSISTTNLGPAPITQGIVRVTTDETDFSNAATPGVVFFEGIQPTPVRGDVALWEYSGTYTLNGNPSGVIPADIFLHGDYESNLATSTISGNMSVVPEPATVCLLGLGFGLAACAERRRPA